MRTERVEHDAQNEEQCVDRKEAEPVAHHVLLCVFQCAAGEVLLHHVLVQSRHDHDDERAADELSPESLSA